MQSTSDAPKQMRKYQRTFLRERGDGPWTCDYCGGPVLKLGKDKEDGAVHHIDEDRSNNDISNLEIMHFNCHRKHHTAGKPALHGYTPEIIEKMAAAHRGKPHIEVPWQCDDCEMRCYKCSMTRHMTASGHTARPDPVEDAA